MRFEWKIEDMLLMKEKPNQIGEKIYQIEKELSREEKIEFLDKRNGGLTSYILNLAEKFQKEDTLKLGTVIVGDELFARIDHDNKIKNWLAYNDTKKAVYNSKYDCDDYDSKHQRGEIKYKPHRLIQDLNYDIDKGKHSDYVDAAFHLELKKLEKMEWQYFKTHDEYSILNKKVNHFIKKHNICFGLNIRANDFEEVEFYKEANKRLLTLDELRILNNKCEQVSSLIKNIEKDIPKMSYDNAINKAEDVKNEQNIELD